jgi:hypothetical protein
VSAKVVYDDGNKRVTLNVTQAMKDQVFERVVRFYKEHDTWTGDSVVQTDEANLDADDTLAEIVDEILRPQITWR